MGSNIWELSSFEPGAILDNENKDALIFLEYKLCFFSVRLTEFLVSAKLPAILYALFHFNRVNLWEIKLQI